MSTSKYIEEILLSGSWKDRRCFLIGGGPSIKNLNPDLIKDELVIGVNKAFTKFNPAINYAMDLRFYEYLTVPPKDDAEKRELQECWKNYAGVKAFLKINPKYQFNKDIYQVRRLVDTTISFDLNKGIYPGSNSGFGAMMLAIALGANPIYLLGYDFIVDEANEKTHWHDGYAKQKCISFIRKLVKFRMLFEDFAPHLLKSGIEVINLNPDSALDCFPKSTISEVLSG